MDDPNKPRRLQIPADAPGTVDELNIRATFDPEGKLTGLNLATRRIVFRGPGGILLPEPEMGQVPESDAFMHLCRMLESIGVTAIRNAAPAPDPNAPQILVIQNGGLSGSSPHS